MKKKVFGILLTLVLALAILPGKAEAAVVDSGACGDNMTWTLEDNGKLTISGTGEMKLSPWYLWDVEIVEIKPGVTSIADWAFQDCDSLTEITIPSSVTKIGDSAFFGCSSLTAVTIPEGVVDIGPKAFLDCDSLTSIIIPASVTSIGDGAFLDCDRLRQIIVPSKNKSFVSLGGVLYNQDRTTLLQYPGGKTGAYTIPDGTTSISSYAFRGSKNLTSVTIPASVTAVDPTAFRACTSLTSIIVAEGNKNCKSVDGVLYDGAETTLLLYPAGRTGVCTIPAGVTTIGYSAFWGCAGVTDVVFPEGLTTIDDYAFLDCDGLTSIVLPEGLESIGYFAFHLCDSLESVAIPGGMERIESYAISSCPALKRVEFRGGAPEFGATAFSGLKTEAYYPAWEPSWTKDVLQDYSGTITWVRYGFADVPRGEFYYEPVMWAMEEGITNGVGNDLFMPVEVCTRKQVVTFLWRAMGSPAPESAENPFLDVTDDDYFYDAVLWAVENGITNGMEDGLFMPDERCTRKQVVTFLHRAAGTPEPKNWENPFADVQQDYYTEAVLWAAGEGITSGVAEDRFDPDGACIRAQIVTFLYRYMAE